ncbi:unnamed protein product [Gongylonema pulchrum]|uniref:Transposase n=1 Tax=Gongylonema pulchrum TaxID=637853 RepID=A0A183E6I2_9BILA|nr:unnamed protein product [Gongylonema pulchrum]
MQRDILRDLDELWSIINLWKESWNPMSNRWTRLEWQQLYGSCLLPAGYENVYCRSRYWFYRGRRNCSAVVVAQDAMQRDILRDVDELWSASGNGRRSAGMAGGSAAARTAEAEAARKTPVWRARDGGTARCRRRTGRL